MITLGSHGGGTNTTGMYIEMVRRQEPSPIAILFADTGGERQRIYEHIKLFSEWLIAHGYPPITTVRSPNETLEENCLRREALPALSYGFKTCSQRFKQDPQKVWANRSPICRAEWKADRQITKLIGYDADETHRVRLPNEPKKYNNRFPLIEWDMGRDDCERLIDEEGLPRPGKSACFFCPATRVPEIHELADSAPDLLERALFMERRALAKTKRLGIDSTIYGLGRRLNWASLFEAFPGDIDTVTPPIPCECYD